MSHKKVKEICKPFSSSILINKMKNNNGDYPLWGAKGLVKNIDTYQQDRPYISIVKWGAGVGRVEIRSEKTSIVATMQGIIPNPDIDIRWLSNALKFLHLENFATKATVPNLYFRDYGEAFIRVPSSTEQKYISDVLEKIEINIEKKRHIINALDNLIKARFVEMFGDRYTNEKGWNIRVLGDCMSFNNGKAHEKVIDEDGKYILITSKAIATDLEDVRRTNVLLSPLVKGDIVMVMSDVPNGRALAKCLLITKNEKYTLNQRICSFNGYSFNPIFLFYLLNRHPYFLSFNDGNGQTNLRKDDILKCPLITPPMKKQESFASFVTQVDKSKFAISQSLLLLTKAFSASSIPHSGQTSVLLSSRDSAG